MLFSQIFELQSDKNNERSARAAKRLHWKTAYTFLQSGCRRYRSLCLRIFGCHGYSIWRTKMSLVLKHKDKVYHRAYLNET